MQTQARNDTVPLNSVQVLRAIAALLVIFAHIYPETLVFGPSTFPNFFLGAIGVDLFFVISGFIMVYASEPMFGRLASAPLFMARRIVRIVPLYWLATTVFLGYLFWSTRGNPIPDLPLHSIVRSYFFIPADRPVTGYFPALSAGWTLYYEMFFYSVFAVAIVLPRYFAVAAVTAFFYAIVHLGYWDSFLFEFVFGMLIAVAFRLGLRLPLWIAPILIAAAVPLWVFVGLENFVSLSRTQAWGGAAAMVVLACTCTEWNRPNLRGFRWAALLGDASYSLYLFHGIVPLGLNEVVVRLGLSGQVPFHPWLYGVVLMVLSIAVGLAVYHWFERPVTRSLQRSVRQILTLDGLKLGVFGRGAARSHVEDDGAVSALPSANASAIT